MVLAGTPGFRRECGAQTPREDHLPEVGAFGCDAIRGEVGSKGIGVSQFLEPLKALLLQMVFGGAGQGIRLKNLPMAGTG